MCGQLLHNFWLWILSEQKWQSGFFMHAVAFFRLHSVYSVFSLLLWCCWWIKTCIFVVTLCTAQPQFAPEGTIKVLGFEPYADTSSNRLFEATILEGYCYVANICCDVRCNHLLTESYQWTCDRYRLPASSDWTVCRNKTPQSSRLRPCVWESVCIFEKECV